jgi:hypothetical protein
VHVCRIRLLHTSLVDRWGILKCLVHTKSTAVVKNCLSCVLGSYFAGSQACTGTYVACVYYQTQKIHYTFLRSCVFIYFSSPLELVKAMSQSSSEVKLPPTIHKQLLQDIEAFNLPLDQVDLNKIITNKSSSGYGEPNTDWRVTISKHFTYLKKR